MQNRSQKNKLILLVLEQIIMFLSDGLPTIGEDPLKVIAEENRILKNKVAVFTYAIGQCKWTIFLIQVHIYPLLQIQLKHIYNYDYNAKGFVWCIFH